MLAGLSRRFPKARGDIEAALAKLPEGPLTQTAQQVPGLGEYKVLKVRVASSDMKVGKSGGFRVILVLCDEARWEWMPVLVYTKKDREDVARADLLAAIEEALGPAPDDAPEPES